MNILAGCIDFLAEFCRRVAVNDLGVDVDGHGSDEDAVKCVVGMVTVAQAAIKNMAGLK